MGEPGHKVVKVVFVVPAPYMGEVVAELGPGAGVWQRTVIIGFANSMGNNFRLLRFHG